VIKSQIPFCGRKWRQSNMKVITAIYLNLRPDLREDWLSGGDVDAEVEESLPQEQALRGLVKYYNASRFSPPVAAGPPYAGQGHGHRRSLSTNLAEGLPQAAPGQEGGAGGLGQGAGAANGLHPPMSPGRQMASFFETDILPPLRRNAEGAATSLRYSLPDELLDGYLDEYDDVLSEVFGGEGTLGDGWSSGKWGLTQDGSQTAWARLGEILGVSSVRGGAGSSADASCRRLSRSRTRRAWARSTSTWRAPAQQKAPARTTSARRRRRKARSRGRT
jgi:hypothetical protein